MRSLMVNKQLFYFLINLLFYYKCYLICGSSCMNYNSLEYLFYLISNNYERKL